MAGGGLCVCTAEQPINEAVITVPSYFNQAERRAMSRAADAAGLRVLQLINDNTAGNAVKNIKSVPRPVEQHFSHTPAYTVQLLM